MLTLSSAAICPKCGEQVTLRYAVEVGTGDWEERASSKLAETAGSISFDKSANLSLRKRLFSRDQNSKPSRSSLLKENDQLKKIVVQLSEIVLRHVIERE